VEEAKMAPPLPADPSYGDNALGIMETKRTPEEEKYCCRELITAATAPMSPNSAPVCGQAEEGREQAKRDRNIMSIGTNRRSLLLGFARNCWPRFIQKAIL
jgi:hypothetical protein